MSKGTSQYAINLEAARKAFSSQQFQEAEAIVCQIFDRAEELLAAGNTQEVDAIRWFIERSLLDTFTGTALAMVFERIAQLEHLAGNRDMSLIFLQEAVSVRKSSARPDNREDVHCLCKSLERLGELAIEGKHWQYAGEVLEQSLSQRQRMNDSDENLRRIRERLSFCRFEQGKQLMNTQQWKPALAAFQQSLDSLGPVRLQADSAQVNRAEILRWQCFCASQDNDYTLAAEAFIASF